MSEKFGLNEALVFTVPTVPRGNTKPPAIGRSHNLNCQLEYLDLSATDNGLDRDRDVKCNSNAMPFTEAEFYSFDDYLPNSTVNLDYENVYVENNNKSVADNCFPSRCSRPRSGYLNESVHLPLEDIMWHRDTGQQETLSCTHSTCSGSSLSSQSSHPSSHIREETGRSHLSQALRKAVTTKGQLPFSQSFSSPVTHTIYDNMNPILSKSLTTDSFRRLAGRQTGRPKSFNSSMPAASMESTKAKSDNQLSSNRTEEILNGIVKLAEHDVLTRPTKETSPAQPIRHKQMLHTSKSSPLLSAAQSPNLNLSKSVILKPSSPPANTSKRFPFSRKGSFSNRHTAEVDRKLEKKSKGSEKGTATAQLNAFLHAVEHFEIEKVTSLISSDNTYVNSVNSQGLTALDIAVLTNHVPMIKVLTKHGAQTKFLDEHIDNNLCTVLQEFINGAEQRVVQLKKASTSGNAQKESEKKINQWEFKHRLFRRMKSGYEQAGLPGQPQNVKLSVTSDSSLHLRFDAPEGSNGAIVTRYKVEWSRAQNFRPLGGEVMINDIHNLEHDITGLDSGVPYFVRVTAWNIKGFGRCSYSDPLYATPSSWRDVENFESRTSNFRLHSIHKIIQNTHQSRNGGRGLARSASTNSQHGSESPTYNRKAAAPLMRGLRGLFSSNFKFQKSLKRGVYLAAVCYNEDDKILVTTEDNLPIVEVDECYSGNSLQAEFDWLMKVVAASWDTARQLKQDLDKLSELSSAHLKHQLLTAVLQLQELMGLQDIGKLFYKPINDGNGSIVLAIVNQLSDPKQAGNIASSLKWQSLSKLVKNSQPSDPLLPLLNEMMFFHQVATNNVPSGLYLGYLHIKIANVDSIKVLAPENNPSVLPYMKIRDSSNVSKPEWKSLLDLGLPGKPHGKPQLDSPDILIFKKQLMKSAKKLANKLGLSAELVGEHRLYDVEVLDFSKDVSFILLMPPRDLVCSGFKPQTRHPDNPEVLEPSSEYMEIPVKAFEMLHLHTYQSEFITAYSKAATIVDTQLSLAQHSQREAFSNEEIESSRKQLESSRLQQQKLEEIWRSTRWLMDAITYARDKANHGVSLTRLCSSILEQLSNGPVSDSFGKSSDDGYHSDKISLGGSSGGDKHRPVSSNGSIQNNTNNNNGRYYDGELDYHHQPEVRQERLEPGILRVYAAYHCGLTRGTSVMLHVTPHTTAREVINLVVMQLNQAVARKGVAAPTYSESQFFDFCLVAVIGPRERVLRDDYKVLQLQNPWTKGKLYVRLKNNLLAALDHGETTDV